MKFMDCSLSTLKTILLCKNKFLLSSILNSTAALLFVFVADAMANAPSDQKWLIAIAVFFANLTGGYFPPKILDRAEKDRLFCYVVTSKDLEQGKILADKLRELNIPVSTTISYGGCSELEKQLTCNVYCAERKQSKIVDSFIQNNDNFKYHIVEAI